LAYVHEINVLFNRKRQQRKRKEMMNMNVLDNTNDEEAEKMSVYDLPLGDIEEGYDNPTITNDVGYSSVKQLPAYESLNDNKTYTPLASSSTVNIGLNTLGNPPEVPPPRADKTQEPPADTKYEVLLRDEGRSDNPPEVPPARVHPPEVPLPRSDNTLESPVDTKYQVLLHDKGKLGNPPDVPPARVHPPEVPLPRSENTLESPAVTKYQVLLHDKGKSGNPPKVPPARVNPPEVPPPRADNNTLEPSADTV